MVLLDDERRELVALMSNRDYLSAEELVAEALRPPAWHAEAACRGQRRQMFFPVRGESVTAAREVCAACPVRLECATVALDDASIVGIWAGSSSRQRLRARAEGWGAQRLLAEVDVAQRQDDTPSTWVTAPCRGCQGLLSRRDVERADHWCWACRPV